DERRQCQNDYLESHPSSSKKLVQYKSRNRTLTRIDQCPGQTSIDVRNAGCKGETGLKKTKRGRQSNSLDWRCRRGQLCSQRRARASNSMASSDGMTRSASSVSADFSYVFVTATVRRPAV